MIFLYIGPERHLDKNGNIKIPDHYAAINEIFISNGFETRYTDTITDPRANPNDLWIGNLSKVHRDWALNEGEEILLPKKYIIWYHTPVRADHVVDLQFDINHVCGLLDNARMFITYESAEIDFYNAEIGIPKNKCYFVPNGYCSFYENYFPLNRNIPKTIDILFYGEGSSRRIRFIQFLRDNGLNVYWAGERAETPCAYEQERSNLISRAKIVMYICPQPPICLGNASTRLGYLISAKVFTIMEGNKYSPFVEELKQYVPTFHDRHEMVNLCTKWLRASDSERRAVTEQAYDFLKANYNMQKMIPIEKIRRIHDEKIC